MYYLQKIDRSQQHLDWYESPNALLKTAILKVRGWMCFLPENFTRVKKLEFRLGICCCMPPVEFSLNWLSNGNNLEQDNGSYLTSRSCLETKDTRMLHVVRQCTDNFLVRLWLISFTGKYGKAFKIYLQHSKSDEVCSSIVLND